MRAFRPESGASLVPWLVVVMVAVLAGGWIFKMHSAHAAQQRELATLRVAVKELEAARVELRELPTLRAQAARAEALKKDNADLPRLRGEVSRLRAEQQQLTQSQAEVQRLQGALRQAAQSSTLSGPSPDAAGNVAVSPGHTASLQEAQASAFHTACVANLRQIDGAKATWALENRKTSFDIPVDEDLFGPRLYIREKPICPGNGSYVLLSVGTKPACTIPGHTI